MPPQPPETMPMGIIDAAAGSFSICRRERLRAHASPMTGQEHLISISRCGEPRHFYSRFFMKPPRQALQMHVALFQAMRRLTCLSYFLYIDDARVTWLPAARADFDAHL